MNRKMMFMVALAVGAFGALSVMPTHAQAGGRVSISVGFGDHGGSRGGWGGSHWNSGGYGRFDRGGFSSLSFGFGFNSGYRDYCGPVYREPIYRETRVYSSSTYCPPVGYSSYYCAPAPVVCAPPVVVYPAPRVYYAPQTYCPPVYSYPAPRYYQSYYGR